jgi:hypothetical protein
MRVLYTVSLVILFAICTPGCAVRRRTVPEASIAAFLQLVEGREFHGIARAGKEVFEEGLYIPNHAEWFGHLPASEPQVGQVRYVLYDFRGAASVGQVYLILERGSGRVVEFDSFEAWFE